MTDVMAAGHAPSRGGARRFGVVAGRLPPEVPILSDSSPERLG